MVDDQHIRAAKDLARQLHKLKNADTDPNWITAARKLMDKAAIYLEILCNDVATLDNLATYRD